MGSLDVSSLGSPLALSWFQVGWPFGCYSVWPSIAPTKTHMCHSGHLSASDSVSPSRSYHWRLGAQSGGLVCFWGVASAWLFLICEIRPDSQQSTNRETRLFFLWGAWVLQTLGTVWKLFPKCPPLELGSTEFTPWGLGHMAWTPSPRVVALQLKKQIKVAFDSSQKGKKKILKWFVLGFRNINQLNVFDEAL